MYVLQKLSKKIIHSYVNLLYTIILNNLNTFKITLNTF